jgi:fucose 4-O-acetylase-like acetyltransferase
VKRFAPSSTLRRSTDTTHDVPVGPVARESAVDWIKAAAILAVVITHAGPAPWAPRFTPWDLWLRTTWVGFHVPAFLMVAGYLYCRARPAGPAEVASRLERLLLPYLVLSPVTYAVVHPPHSLWVALATASAHPIYYYFYAIVPCVLLILPLSRMSRRAIAAMLGLLVCALLAHEIDPRAALARSWFWLMRDPFVNFYFGYFLLGWLAALERERLRTLLRTHRRTVVVVACVGLTTFPASVLGVLPIGETLMRIPYSISVVTLLVLFVPRGPAPSWIRSISDSTLAIYLVHVVVQTWLYAWVAPWHPLPRTLAMTAGSLAGSLLVCRAAQRLLGPRRARRLLGA